MLHSKALRWSADPEVTPGQLKEDSYQFVWSCNEIHDRLVKQNIHAWVLDEDDYHFKLHRCSSKPIVLYYRGENWLLDKWLLAVVGPRKPTSYLTQVTKDVCQLLPNYQVSTISGGAQGIDELAHRCCLENNVPTIIVLGTGFRRVRRSRYLHFLQEIVEAWWLVLSERKIDQEPTTYTFPQRNRLIAWLADAVFVPGASQKSWSLITIDFARQYNVPIATVPGSIYEGACAWTNRYLVERKIEGVIDFPAFLGKYFILKSWKEKAKTEQVFSDQERILLETLQEQSLDVTTLIHLTGQDVPSLMEALLHLEMKQLIYCPEPGIYSRK